MLGGLVEWVADCGCIHPRPIQQKFNVISFQVHLLFPENRRNFYSNDRFAVGIGMGMGGWGWHCVWNGEWNDFVSYSCRTVAFNSMWLEGASDNSAGIHEHGRNGTYVSPVFT